jgi:hypothetical protein
MPTKLGYSIGLTLIAFVCPAFADDAPTLEQAGGFIQRQLDGIELTIVMNPDPVFAHRHWYRSLKVSGCSMAVTEEVAFGPIDSQPQLRQTYELSFKAIDPTSLVSKLQFQAGVLEGDLTQPITKASTNLKTNEVVTSKENKLQLFFGDATIAERTKKAFARAAELCGAKKDVF